MDATVQVAVDATLQVAVASAMQRTFKVPHAILPVINVNHADVAVATVEVGACLDITHDVVTVCSFVNRSGR